AACRQHGPVGRQRRRAGLGPRAIGQRAARPLAPVHRQRLFARLECGLAVRRLFLGAVERVLLGARARLALRLADRRRRPDAARLLRRRPALVRPVGAARRVRDG
ncbi:uncharacterized protein RHOBADRAFT_28857, partial [Rhodotorula graminis WP1]